MHYFAIKIRLYIVHVRLKLCNCIPGVTQFQILRQIIEVLELVIDEIFRDFPEKLLMSKFSSALSRIVLSFRQKIECTPYWDIMRPAESNRIVKSRFN